MSKSDSLTILVNLRAGLSESRRRNMQKNVRAAYYFTAGMGDSLEAIVAHKPQIALVSGENSQECARKIKAFRRQSPGLIIIALLESLPRDCGQAGEKLRVFSILPESVAPMDLVSILRKAVAYYEEKKNQLALQKQSELHKGAQAQWLLWRENQTKLNRLNFTRSVIRNILHSASQGLGVGATLTHVELLQLAARKDQDSIRVDAETFEALVHNAEAARQWLTGFENILSAFSRNFVTEELGAETILGDLETILNEAEKFRSIKNHRIVVERLPLQGSFLGNGEVFREAFGELLLNAFKYSPAATTINITTYTTEDFTAFVVINDIEPMVGGISGIPAEYQTQIFEPFFRLNNTWDDRYNDQKFGLGVGLTAAENAVQQCGGRLYVYEAEVQSPETAQVEVKPVRRIIAELVMPKVLRT